MHLMRRCVIALVLGLAACAADDAAFGVEDERFIATMVELRRAAMTTGSDTAQFELLRRQILEEQNVTEDGLRAYIDARAGNLDHMAAVWDSIGARLSDAPPE